MGSYLELKFTYCDFLQSSREVFAPIQNFPIEFRNVLYALDDHLFCCGLMLREM